MLNQVAASLDATQGSIKCFDLCCSKIELDGPRSIPDIAVSAVSGPTVWLTQLPLQWVSGALCFSSHSHIWTWMKANHFNRMKWFQKVALPFMSPSA
jgi:hypothetical protein